MTRRIVILASDNKGKLAELKHLTKDMPFDVRPQSDYGLSTPPETGDTFAANATLKARYACRETGHVALADDSGLIVDALNGEPGIYSARYAGENANSTDNIRKLLSKMSELPGLSEADRTARFFCALACTFPPPDEDLLEVSGVWEGRITKEPHGEKGFGYDPVFYVPEMRCTVAELPPEKKIAMSHRGKALQKLRNALLERLNQTA